MKKSLSFLIVIVDLIIISLVFFSSKSLDMTIEKVSFISLLVSLFILFIQLPIKKGEGFIYAFFCVYIVCIFGRGILKYTFGFTPSTWYFDILQFYSDREIIQAFLLGIYSLLTLHIGLMFCRLFLQNRIEVKEANKKDIKILQVTAWVIFSIAIIPAIITYSSEFLGASNITNDVGTLIGMASSLMLPFFIIILTTYKSRMAFVVGIFYYFPQLLWGGRGEPILSIGILVFLYYKFVNNKKIRVLKLTLFSLLAIAILNLFVVIKEVRGLSFSQWIDELPTLYLDKLLNSNPVLEIVYEIGVALAPTAATIRLVPEYISVQFGTTILYSLTTAIPDLLGLRPAFMSEYGNVPNLISQKSGSSFGGSILQDFFINFMWLTPVIMVLIGILIARYSNLISLEVNLVKISFYIILFYPILWWPRSSLGFLFRYSFITIVIPVVVYYLLKIFFNRKGGVNSESS